MEASVLGQLASQSFPLQAGWNAIYLELEPENGAPDVLFTNLPIASVWTYQPRRSTVQFIESQQTETNFNREEWLVHFPSQRPESFRNNLFALTGSRAYVIHCTNTATLTVQGQPAVRPVKWIPDAYNLIGFPLDPDAAPTFKAFFMSSAAHFDGAANRFTKDLYRMNSQGRWETVGPNDLMRRGEAYWVYGKGGSDYGGPLAIDLVGGELDFGQIQDQLTFRLHNLTDPSITVEMRESTQPTPLACAHWDPANGIQWRPLSNVRWLTLGGREWSTVRLALNRQQMSASTYQSLLVIKSSVGVTYRVGIKAAKTAGSEASTSALAGLWVGTATINAVSEPANTSDPTTPTRVKNPLNLRLLMHVDGQGKARLLKEVYQMYRPATFTNAPDGFKRQDQPGQTVLFTAADDRIRSPYQGVVLKDGTLTGRRWSTASYDFDGGTNNYLDLTGTFAMGSSVTGMITIPANFPTNPFRHRYHPDHDNLDPTFKMFQEEAYPFSRQITWSLTPENPEGSTGPDYGYQAVGGRYQEKVHGAHKTDIHLQGVFSLRRVETAAELNP